MLMFMGGEIGQSGEWNANGEVSWDLLAAGPYHQGTQQLVKDLNQLYQAEPCLWEADYETIGFQWIDASDNQNSVVSFVRRDSKDKSQLVVIMNLTPVPRHKYRIGLPRPGKWLEVLNTDAASYGGGNIGNLGGVTAIEGDCHGQPNSAEFTLPPLSMVAFKPERLDLKPKPKTAPLEMALEPKSLTPETGRTAVTPVSNLLKPPA
jgi:1,4-alpha-glucan branching enzyme